jgi:hypothetical protein
MGGAMTTHTSAETRRTDHEAGADASRFVRSLGQIFPAWVCWYGGTTRSWWAMPPPAYRYPGLIEAPTPEELAQRIRRLLMSQHRVQFHRTNTHHHRDLA